MSSGRPARPVFFQDYTRDLTTDDLQRLFTRDTREAYHFFARHVDLRQFDGLPWHRRIPVQARVLFLAFTMKLSPARRAVYAFALVAAARRAARTRSACRTRPRRRHAAGC